MTVMNDMYAQVPKFAELTPGVRRVLAPNPSIMTGPGTNTYLFGESAIAVVDPGPAIDAHIDEIQSRAGAPIHWILVTHTHPDHSPGAALLAEATGAELIGRPAPDGFHQDQSFKPTRVFGDGDTLATDEFELEAIHTPGHASNHLCFRHVATDWIVTGDHIIEGSTVVINPPDGNMSHYIASLKKVRAMQPAALLPGHGGRIDDPRGVIDWTIDHRLQRESSVRAALEANPRLTSAELVPHVYKDVPEHLHGWAERSLLAHLLKLQADGVADAIDECWQVL